HQRGDEEKETAHEILLHGLITVFAGWASTRGEIVARRPVAWSFSALSL
ncbi:MAG: hypothetical protein IIC87_07905, partial [Chloroflexi bacterium]|nr:hypothetical protein [Chloroflexota bacterium]